ncbi:MAG TPA: YwiC-like family protein [Bryobacteraceae bacterium]|nr:YwiC-like family protein [Bryobacteraceae bacterium]
MKLRLPREHGTWGMFFVPFAAGWLAAGHFRWPVLLLLLASSAVFLSRETLLFWWRARHYGKDPEDATRALVFYAAAAAAFGAPLVVVWKLYALIALGFAGLIALVATAELTVRRQGRSAATEFLAIAISALNAASAHYVAAGRWTAEAFWLWALCTLYFASSIFYVKLRVQDAHGKRDRDVIRARRRCAAYHAVLLAALAALVVTRSVPLFALIAFIPILVRAFAEVFSPSRELNLKRVGWLEVTWSLVFLCVVGLGFGS